MFDYKKFKKVMKLKGHKVYKKGIYIKIIPNNNQPQGYGFRFASDVILGFNKDLRLIRMDHFNTEIYFLKYVIDEDWQDAEWEESRIEKLYGCADEEVQHD